MILIGATSTLGYLESHKLKRRVDFLRQYLKFLQYIETQVRYSAGVVHDLIRKYSAKGDFGLFLGDCLANIENQMVFQSAWSEAVHSVKESCGLSREDSGLISDFALGFGDSDIAGQVDYCRMNEELMRGHLSVAIDEKEKKSKLYLLLGIFSGITLVLIFI